MPVNKNGIRNLRDLGGIRLSDGTFVRKGLIYRSASLDALSEEDCTLLREDCRIATVIDLRTPLEVSEKPDTVIPGIEYVHIPIFKESVIGISKETGSDTGAYIKRTWNRAAIRAAIPDMNAIYSSVLADAEIVARIADVIHIVISNALQGRSTLFHCSQGKDRTGAVAALLLSLMGADRDTVFSDYEQGGRIYRRKALKDAILITIFKLDPKSARTVYHANLAERGFIAASFRTIDELYGSPAEFFRTCIGINDELRERFLAVVRA